LAGFKEPLVNVEKRVKWKELKEKEGRDRLTKGTGENNPQINFCVRPW